MWRPPEFDPAYLRVRPLERLTCLAPSWCTRTCSRIPGKLPMGRWAFALVVVTELPLRTAPVGCRSPLRLFRPPPFNRPPVGCRWRPDFERPCVPGGLLPPYYELDSPLALLLRPAKNTDFVPFFARHMAFRMSRLGAGRSPWSPFNGLSSRGADVYSSGGCGKKVVKSGNSNVIQPLAGLPPWSNSRVTAPTALDGLGRKVDGIGWGRGSAARDGAFALLCDSVWWACVHVDMSTCEHVRNFLRPGGIIGAVRFRLSYRSREACVYSSRSRFGRSVRFLFTPWASN